MTSVTVEVSVGELIDKLTILEIKTERIDDPGKLAKAGTLTRYLYQVRL